MYKITSKKRLILFSMILLSVFLIVGCTNNNNEINRDSEESLNISINLAPEIKEEALTDEFDIEIIEIEILNRADASDAHSDSQNVLNEDSVSFKFDNLKNGATYDINVRANDTDGYEVYKGSSTATITGETNTSLGLEIVEAEGLTLRFENFPSDTVTGEVILLPSENNLEAPIDMENGVASFDSLPANEYLLRINLYDGTGEEISTRTGEILVLPGRNTITDLIDLGGNSGEKGSLVINPRWQEAPNAPTGLDAAVTGSSVELAWNSSEDRFVVYRSESNSSPIPLVESTITGNSYTDNNVEEGKTYYYWVRAFDEDLLRSNLSNSVDVYIEPTHVFDGVIIYVKADNAPAIWAWEVEGEAITANRGAEWPGETLEAVSAGEMNDSDGWFKYEIIAEELEGGLEIQFKLDGQPEGDTPGTTLPNSETGWYDNGTWSDHDPTEPVGPVKPEVSISLRSGDYTGDTSVDATVSGEGITSQSAEFDGQSVNLPIILEDYLNDGESGTLVVSATNEAGTTTESATFTRDDEVVVQDDYFTWDNATVYFAMPDRFYDGDPSNNNSYGRPQVDTTGSDIGTFHGGDIVGMTEKLDHIESVGANAIWITAPYEQAHGAVGGADNGEFGHYAYHGYYPLDWTMIDKNIGTVEEFRAFVDDAHSRGIRIVLDIVMNHPGYATLVDGARYGYATDLSLEEAKNFTPDNNWHDVHNQIDYDNESAWEGYWGPDWIRAGLPGYEVGDQNNDLTMNLEDLPDIRTEFTHDVGLAPLLETKWSRETSANGYGDWIIPAAKQYRQDIGAAPYEYIVSWLSAWVEEFGIDGFRVDTAKHVEIERWGALKDAANDALWRWRENNPDAPGAHWDDDFWMTAEIWNKGLNEGSNYYNNGFDSIINFQFQGGYDAGDHSLNRGPAFSSPTDMGGTFQDYADRINSNDNFNVLSYISQHDTKLYNEQGGNLIDGGTNLLLLPGAVQIFYGDETDRRVNDGANIPSDPAQGTRSFMNWDSMNNDVLSHWQKVGQFRRDNVAVGAGQHSDLGNNTYGRTYTRSDGEENKVVFMVGADGSTSVNVGDIFADGTEVRNAYTGETGTISSGSVTFTGENGVILIELAQ